jgi:hypothetical protein
MTTVSGNPSQQWFHLSGTAGGQDESVIAFFDIGMQKFQVLLPEPFKGPEIDIDAHAERILRG